MEIIIGDGHTDMQQEKNILDSHSFKKRVDYLDICKGLGILLVVYCHATPVVGYVFFASFHIPAFL